MCEKLGDISAKNKTNLDEIGFVRSRYGRETA
jgi:hypothetical protein